MKIEFFYSPTCKNSPKVLKLLKKVLKQEKIADPLAEVPVQDDETARRLGMYGSPSIHIDGRDIEDKPAGTPTGHA